MHPRFDRARAEEFLRKTDIKMKSRVRELSKGMVTQLHLALILAIDARLLVLDEPTLGLDLLYPPPVLRHAAERLLRQGAHDPPHHAPGGRDREPAHRRHLHQPRAHRARLVRSKTSPTRYVQVNVKPDQAARARELKPFYEREIFGRVAMFFEGRSRG